MLTPYESELFKGVAYQPLEGPRLLISPEINMGSTWFSSPEAVKIFSAIAEHALLNKPVTFASLMVACNIQGGERNYLLDLWNKGKIEQTDMTSVIGIMRHESMEREVGRVIKDYQSKLKARPEEIEEHINDMGAELATISHDGAGYDPDPTTHYDDGGTEVVGSWGCRTIDAIFGGVLSSGFGLLIAPSGFGKSSFSRTLTAFAVLQYATGHDLSVLIAVNEMDSGVTSRGLRDALRHMWGESRSHDQINQDIRESVRLYEDAYSFSRFEQMIYWHRPNIAIIDSLDALSFSGKSEKFKDPNDRHQARAIELHDISKRYGCFIFVPANAAGDGQILLKQGNLDKVHEARAFGSIWYQNKSTVSTVMTWDVDNPGISLFKNTKDRMRGQKGVGVVHSMAHSEYGRYYTDPHEIVLNP